MSGVSKREREKERKYRILSCVLSMYGRNVGCGRKIGKGKSWPKFRVPPRVLGLSIWWSMCSLVVDGNFVQTSLNRDARFGHAVEANPDYALAAHRNTHQISCSTTHQSQHQICSENFRFSWIFSHYTKTQTTKIICVCLPHTNFVFMLLLLLKKKKKRIANGLYPFLCAESPEGCKHDVVGDFYAKWKFVNAKSVL